MDAAKKKAIAAAGFRSGDVSDLFGLSEEERQVVEMRAMIALRVRQRREGLNLTQRGLAERLGMRQPRVARIEAGGVGVTLDQMFRAFFAVGGRVEDLAARAPAPAPGKGKARPKADRKKAGPPVGV